MQRFQAVNMRMLQKFNPHTAFGEATHSNGKYITRNDQKSKIANSTWKNIASWAKAYAAWHVEWSLSIMRLTHGRCPRYTFNPTALPLSWIPRYSRRSAVLATPQFYTLWIPLCRHQAGASKEWEYPLWFRQGTHYCVRSSIEITK